MKSTHKSRHVRIKELQHIVGLSASSIWRKAKDGTFVAPIKLSTRITVWKRADVDQWLADREAGQ